MRQCHVNQIHCKFMEYAVFWGICQFSRSEVFSEQVLLSAAKMYLKAAAAVVLRSRTSYSQVCVYCNTYHHCTLPITLMQQDFRNIGDKIWHNMAHCGTVGMESFPQWSCISSSESFNNLHLLVQTRCGYSAEISSVLSTLSSIKSSYRRYSIAIKRSVISPFGLLSPAILLFWNVNVYHNPYRFVVSAVFGGRLFVVKGSPLCRCYQCCCCCCGIGCHVTSHLVFLSCTWFRRSPTVEKLKASVQHVQ